MVRSGVGRSASLLGKTAPCLSPMTEPRQSGTSPTQANKVFENYKRQPNRSAAFSLRGILAQVRSQPLAHNQARKLEKGAPEKVSPSLLWRSWQPAHPDSSHPADGEQIVS